MIIINIELYCIAINVVDIQEILATQGYLHSLNRIEFALDVLYMEGKVCYQFSVTTYCYCYCDALNFITYMHIFHCFRTLCCLEYITTPMFVFLCYIIVVFITIEISPTGPCIVSESIGDGGNALC